MLDRSDAMFETNRWSFDCCVDGRRRRKRKKKAQERREFAREFKRVQ
jgi:hypothetical protein